MLDQSTPGRRRRPRGTGCDPVVHPHVGGYIEFEDEVERLVADTDLDLCIDTGHFAYAGIDPVAAIERYADRLGHIHFKDIRPDVLARVDAEGLDFWEAIEAGVFCPIGEGWSTSAACSTRSTRSATTASPRSSRTGCPAAARRSTTCAGASP